MPRMKPPKDAIGLRYNGCLVEVNDSIDIAAPDVEALQGEGWEIENESTGKNEEPTEVDDG